LGHLSALQKAGITSNISPNLLEVRGYVMLMLHRTHNSKSLILPITDDLLSNNNTNQNIPSQGEENISNTQEQD
jgi:hypothetical protein